MTRTNQPPRGNPRIGPTAHVTAQAWRRAGFPGADLFDTWLGRLGYDAASAGLLPWRLLGHPAGNGLAWLRLRHQWLESRLTALRPSLVIEVGAGLSSRGLTQARCHPELAYLELDLPGMVAAKRRRLHATPTPDNYRLETLDLLSADFAVSAWQLARAGDGPCLVITEGVVDYLSASDRETAWTHIAALLRQAGGGHYLLDLHTSARLRRLGLPVGIMLNALNRLTGHDFGGNLLATTDEAIETLRRCGFDQAAVLNPAALDSGGQPVPASGRFYDLIEATIEPGSG